MDDGINFEIGRVVQRGELAATSFVSNCVDYIYIYHLSYLF